MCSSDLCRLLHRLPVLNLSLSLALLFFIICDINNKSNSFPTNDCVSLLQYNTRPLPLIVYCTYILIPYHTKSGILNHDLYFFRELNKSLHFSKTQTFIKNMLPKRFQAHKAFLKTLISNPSRHHLKQQPVCPKRPHQVPVSDSQKSILYSCPKFHLHTSHILKPYLVHHSVLLIGIQIGRAHV